MSPLPLNYLRTLIVGIAALEEPFNRCLQEWGAQTPPDTIIFTEIGRAIGARFSAFTAEEQRRLFVGIEEGMLSHDAALRTAMATGLVEALVAKADKSPDLWSDFEKLLGTTSMEHALAWRTFGHRLD